MDCDEVSSPTFGTESTLMTAVIEELEDRDVATCNIPNVFVQRDVKKIDKDSN